MCQAVTNEAFTLDEKDSDKKSKKVSEREWAILKAYP